MFFFKTRFFSKYSTQAVIVEKGVYIYYIEKIRYAVKGNFKCMTIFNSPS